MKLFTTKKIWLGLISVAMMNVAMAQGSGSAQYPIKPIRLVVPFAPGGPTDIAARSISQKLSESLGQSIVVENKPGAGGTLGSADVARAAADGYTLLYGSSSTLAVSPALYENLSYDAANAFAPVGMVARGPQVIVINNSLPVSNFKEFVEYAKKNHGSIFYSSAGIGSVGNLASELLINTVGIEATHVPYKGGSPAINAVVAGETHFTIDAVGTTAEFVKAGKLKAIAVLSDARTNFAPSVPTVNEAGFPPVVADFWSGIVAPAGTPQIVIDKLNAAIVAALKGPDVTKQLRTLGSEPQGGTPSEFASLIKTESAKWAEVVKRSGAKPGN